jgi:hypothetical protein
MKGVFRARRGADIFLDMPGHHGIRHNNIPPSSTQFALLTVADRGNPTLTRR